MANNSRIKRFKSKLHVTINSAILKDKNVSLKAKGLFALVMSLPDSWDFSLKGICAITKENYTAVNSSIKELIDAGYCHREPLKEHGKFVGYNYEFYEVKTDSPYLGFLNMENPNVENLKTNNNYSTILNSPIKEDKKEDNSTILNSPVIDKEEKIILSDDNKKSDDLFDLIWKKYHKGSKKKALNAWSKLKDKQKELALKNVDDYLIYCKRSGRPLKDVSTYLNGECFNDDWSAIPDCYQVNDLDDDRTKRFKRYMVSKFPDLIYHRNPLTYEQCDELFDEYGVGPFEEAMKRLCGRDIHQYYSIKSGVEHVLKEVQDDNI